MITHSAAVNKALMKASSMGCLVHRNEVGLFYDLRGNKRKIGVVGRGDIDGLTPFKGRALAIEVKTGGASRSPEQKRWAARFESLGGLYIVARYDDERGIDGDEIIERALNDAMAEHKGVESNAA
ncbi:MAG: hypothetical protein ACR2RE_00910 [Geminicoccaceae bacterium]